MMLATRQATLKTRLLGMIWRQWIDTAIWTHFLVLICRICWMNGIKRREGDVTAGLRRLLDRPLNTRCMLCFEQESRSREGRYTDINDFLPIILWCTHDKTVQFWCLDRQICCRYLCGYKDDTELSPWSVYNTWQPLNSGWDHNMFGYSLLIR